MAHKPWWLNQWKPLNCIIQWSSFQKHDIDSVVLPFQDYYTIRAITPILDTQQDWMLLNASEENSVTTLKFYRKRNTTDQQNDTAIPVKYLWTNIILERFSIKCHKNKTKVITLASHKGHRKSSEPIKTPSNYLKLRKSAGKRVRMSRDWFWFYFWLDEKVVRTFRANRVAYKVQNQLLFDSQIKTVLSSW